MNEEMREEFEAWIIKSNATGRVPNFIMKNDNGAYIDPQTSDLWISWQASREAMKPIKLPDFNVFIHSDCWFDGESEHVMEDFDVSECRNFLVEVIQQAGYKVAP